MSQLQIATDIAREAGEILVSYFRSADMGARAKGPRDVVTQADFDAESLIRGRLQEHFPADAIRGEEGTDVRSGNRREWFVDPLDGTLNYSRGLPIWCVSLSLFEGGIPILGVIRDPLNDETFTATRGGGAFLNGKKMMTSGLTDLSAAFAHLTVDFRDDSMLEGLDDIALVAPKILRVRNTGSASLALAYVACGRFDAMLHRFAHAWDYGAGIILIQEAGGSVTDMDGESYRSETVSVAAAATDPLRSELLGLIQAPSGASLQ